MKRYFVSLTVLGAMAATMAIAQTAQNPAPPQAHSPKRLAQALELTAAQKAQAKTIRQNTRQQAQPIAQQLKQDRQSLRAAIQADNTGQIQQLSTAMGTLQGQALAVRSAGRAQFYAILTPDQKTKAAAFEQKAHGGPGLKGE